MSSKIETFAAGVCIVALVCAAFSLLSFTLDVGQFLLGRDRSISPHAVMVCTLTLTIVCTIVALILVGPRRCKLAWMSLGLFLFQFVLIFALEAFMRSK